MLVSPKRQDAKLPPPSSTNFCLKNTVSQKSECDNLIVNLQDFITEVRDLVAHPSIERRGASYDTLKAPLIESIPRCDKESLEKFSLREMKCLPSGSAFFLVQ